MNKFETVYLQDAYKWFADKMVNDSNGALKLEYHSELAMKGINLVVDSKTSEVVMSYTMYRAIINKCNKLLIDEVGFGQEFNLGYSLGKIRGRRINRNFKKKKLDIYNTLRLRKELNDPDIKIYFTSDDYCRIEWEKIKSLNNSNIYELNVAPGFRKRFHTILKENPLVELLYYHDS